MDKPELNTVISWLEGLTWDDWSDYHSGSAVQNIAKSALELLKKQQKEIDEIADEYIDHGKKMAKQSKIVCCKDCKWYVQNRMFQCGAHCIPVKNPDWFCADGERR